MSTKPLDQTHILLSSGVHLLNEDWIISAMGNGMTRRGFRAWMANLELPLMEHGRSRYVDRAEFLILMKCLTRRGGKNFFVAGCDTIQRGERTESLRVGLTQEEFEANYHDVVRDLCSSKVINETQTMDNLRDYSAQVAEKLARTMIPIHDAILRRMSSAPSSEQEQEEEGFQPRQEVGEEAEW